MDSADELKTMRYKAFEFENRPESAPYHSQLARYEAAVLATKVRLDAATKSELAQAFLELRQAFVAWREEP
jgi:hypothetical protein